MRYNPCFVSFNLHSLSLSPISLTQIPLDLEARARNQHLTHPPPPAFQWPVVVSNASSFTQVTWWLKFMCKEVTSPMVTIPRYHVAASQLPGLVAPWVAASECRHITGSYCDTSLIHVTTTITSCCYLKGLLTVATHPPHLKRMCCYNCLCRWAPTAQLSQCLKCTSTLPSTLPCEVGL